MLVLRCRRCSAARRSGRFIGGNVWRKQDRRLWTPSTIWDWSGLIKSDTSSVGRIWTDKTVSDGEISKDGVTISKANGADFLTALTALSSTSNLSDTATTPLDIVLVLDASGSMDDPMGNGDGTKH